MVIETNQEQDETIDQLLVLLKNTLRENHASSDRLLGVAVGVPGLVDYETGTLLFAPNLGWRDAQLGRVLADQFDAPVIIDNEANLAALGETYFGAARGYREVLYISAGVGIGGGIVRDGAVMRGIAGFAGEFGHMTVDPHGDLCNCGNHGCWETSASQRALFDHIYKAFASGRKSMLQDLVHGNMKALSVPVIVEAAQIGDALALEAIQSIGQRLGIGIASLVNAYNPELVVFGGPISLAWEFLGPLIKEQIVLRSLRWNRETTHLVRARHGADACVMGGVAAVCNQVLVRPSSRLSNVSIPALLSNRGGINFGKEVSSSRRNNSPLRSIAEPSNSLTTSDRR
jgi:glucokinase-like ROK family protein